jgi:GNAT superfamily N-acetyltransferase
MGPCSTRLIWVQDHPVGARTRLMLKAYTDADQRPRDPSVTELGASAAASTFPGFARDLATDGFGFLCERVTAGKDDGPVLVCVDEDQIVGAVGPLSVMADEAGRRFVPPQYFAVHPAYRRRGHGQALWHAAMTWGHGSGAEYKVLQTQADVPPSSSTRLRACQRWGSPASGRSPKRPGPGAWRVGVLCMLAETLRFFLTVAGRLGLGQ